jgi:hypothetical protein
MHLESHHELQGFGKTQGESRLDYIGTPLNEHWGMWGVGVARLVHELIM